MSFPVLDFDRSADVDRVVTESFPSVKPLVAETDAWVELPVRLINRPGLGYILEVGPYDLHTTDIAVLREAIAAFDKEVAA